MYQPDSDVIRTLTEALANVTSDLQLLGDPNTVTNATLLRIVSHIRKYQPDTKKTPLNDFINMAVQANADPVYQQCFGVHMQNIDLYNCLHHEGFNPFDVFDWLNQLKRELVNALSAIQLKADYSKLYAHLGDEYSKFCAGQGNDLPIHPLLAALRLTTQYTINIIEFDKSIPEPEQMRYALKLLITLVDEERFPSGSPNQANGLL